jgi:hypothetical protein
VDFHLKWKLVIIRFATAEAASLTTCGAGIFDNVAVGIADSDKSQVCVAVDKLRWRLPAHGGQLAIEGGATVVHPDMHMGSPRPD